MLNEIFNLEEIETPIPIDTSVEDWIKEIEENVKANKEYHIAKEKTSQGTAVHTFTTDLPFMKELMKYKVISELNGIY